MPEKVLVEVLSPSGKTGYRKLPTDGERIVYGRKLDGTNLTFRMPDKGNPWFMREQKAWWSLWLLKGNPVPYFKWNYGSESAIAREDLQETDMIPPFGRKEFMKLLDRVVGHGLSRQKPFSNTALYLLFGMMLFVLILNFLIIRRIGI